MFESLIERATRAGGRRAQRRAGGLAERLQNEMPQGVRASVIQGGVALTGRGLARRFALDPALRWIAARLA